MLRQLCLGLPLDIFCPPSAIDSLLLLALINPPSIGETSRPILVSDTQTLSVTIDGEPYANGQWELSPKFDPDLLLIRSKLPYGSKQVTFSSGVDSITFDVQAGNDYDFTVLRNEETPCHIRIAALADPWCWSYQVLLPTLAIAVVLVTALTMKRRQIATSRLLAMGLVAPLLFWVITIVLGAILTDYNHLQNTISELGAVRSKTEAAASVAFLFLAFLCLLFSAGLYRACLARELSTAPAWMTLCMPIGFSWAALFPLGNELHGLLGPLPLLLNLGALFAFFQWRSRDDYRAEARFSLVSFLIMTMLFLVFIDSVARSYEGLVQRLWYLGWTIWCISLGLRFSKPMPRESEASASIR